MSWYLNTFKEVAGTGIGIIILFILIYIAVMLAASWKIFEKAGRPGWHAVVPVLNIFEEYEFSWTGMYGALFLAATGIYSLSSSILYNIDPASQAASIAGIIDSVALIVMYALNITQNIKLSKAFGHGVLFGIGLLIFTPIFRLILAFRKSVYVKPREM